jgi:hypothetical protein
MATCQNGYGSSLRTTFIGMGQMVTSGGFLEEPTYQYVLSRGSHEITHIQTKTMSLQTKTYN